MSDFWCASAPVRFPRDWCGQRDASPAASKPLGSRSTSRRPTNPRLSEKDREQLSQTLNLVEQLGGETATLSGHSLADELIHYARSRNVTKIIVGKPSRPRWKEWLQGSLVYELTRKCGDIDVYVITGDPGKGATPTSSEPAQPSSSANAYLASLATVVGMHAGKLAFVAFSVPRRHLIMVYLLGVVVVATRFGPGPSVLASVLSVAAFDFFFIPPVFHICRPRHTVLLHVRRDAGHGLNNQHTDDSRYLPGRVGSHARATNCVALRDQPSVGRGPHSRTDRTGGDSSCRRGRRRQSCDPVDRDQRRSAWLRSAAKQRVSNLVHTTRPSLGGCSTTEKPPATAPPRCPAPPGSIFPLRASHGSVGVLGVLPNRAWRPCRARATASSGDAVAGLIALAVERVQLAAEAARIRVQMETEKLRSSLLSAVSHDLRTPLSVITGAASTLLDSVRRLQPKLRRELLGSILDEAEHLNRLVANLLGHDSTGGRSARGAQGVAVSSRRSSARHWVVCRNN